MLENYIEEQPFVTNLLIKSIRNKKIVQAYLFNYSNIEYIYEYAKSFSKDLICEQNKKEYKNICSKIDKEIYTELKIIEPINNCIKKEQLLNLQNEVKNKPVEGNKIVYIIKNCEKLNQSAANCILKFLEEPNDDIVAILLTNNINRVISTIKSRCQIYNFNVMENKKTKMETSFEQLLFLKNAEISDEEFLNLIDTSINFIKNCESKKINSFINIKKYVWEKIKDRDSMYIFLDLLIYFYFDVLYKQIGKNLKYYNSYEEEINQVSSSNNLSDVTNKITKIEKLKEHAFSNVNMKLLFDKLIIELSGDYE